jgi:hypothetical protein
MQTSFAVEIASPARRAESARATSRGDVRRDSGACSACTAAALPRRRERDGTTAPTALVTMMTARWIIVRRARPGGPPSWVSTGARGILWPQHERPLARLLSRSPSAFLRLPVERMQGAMSLSVLPHLDMGILREYAPSALSSQRCSCPEGHGFERKRRRRGEIKWLAPSGHRHEMSLYCM